MLDTTISNILKTKIIPPAAKQHAVIRDRLLDSITAGLRGRLTLLSAPAGFGKSMLLAQWAHSEQRRIAWVHLDELDNDPIRFWRYVAYAVAAAVPEPAFGKLIQLSRALPHISTTTFVDALTNELYHLTQPLTLILDDFHTIGNRSIHTSFVYWLDYLPEHIHIIISTRTELPFSTAKWLAKQQRNDIDAKQLQFNLEETEQYLRTFPGLSLNTRQIEQLVQRTEGWITGLQLASLSLRAETNVGRLIDAFSGQHRNVADYLLYEVVGKLSPELYRFLLITSVIGRLNSSVCNAVTEGTDSLRLLETAKQLNLFLIPLDERNDWFRYHLIFAQFLQDRLRRSEPEIWTRSHRLASEWFAENGDFDDAIDHAMSAQDYHAMSKYMLPHLPTVLDRGELDTLLRWFEGFPKGFPYGSELQLWHAFVLVLAGRLQQAEELLETIESAIHRLEDLAQLRSGILFVRSNLAFANGDFSKWFAFIEGILDDIVPENPAFYNFNYNRNEPFVRRTSLGLKGVLSSDTETIGRMFTGVLEKHGWRDSLLNLYVKQSLCEGYYEWNRLEDSRAMLPELERIARNKRLPGLLIPVRLMQARLHMAEERPQMAYDIIDETMEYASGLEQAHWLEILYVFKSCLYLRNGKLGKAKKELAALGISAKSKPTFNREPAYVALARMLGLQHKESEALRILEQLKPQSEREQLVSSVVEISCLEALLEYQRGHRMAALRHLHDALTIGERFGYARSFIDEGQAMARLISVYVHEIEPQSPSPFGVRAPLENIRAYAAGLLALFPNGSRRKNKQNAQAMTEPLSGSEYNLLHLISEGASNKQIAQTLSLSEGTVKVYLSRLYGKLGVSSRTQALAAAQHLLNPSGD